LPWLRRRRVLYRAIPCEQGSFSVVFRRFPGASGSLRRPRAGRMRDESSFSAATTGGRRSDDRTRGRRPKLPDTLSRRALLDMSFRGGTGGHGRALAVMFPANRNFVVFRRALACPRVPGLCTRLVPAARCLLVTSNGQGGNATYHEAAARRGGSAGGEWTNSTSGVTGRSVTRPHSTRIDNRTSDDLT
jgi:hypothetical protein